MTEFTSLRPTSGASHASSNTPLSERSSGKQPATRGLHSNSVSSNAASSSRGSAAAEGREKNRTVRTLPPWVQSVEEDDDDLEAARRLPPRTPPSARPAYHPYIPTPKPNADRGRVFDHVREGTPVTITTPVSETASKWQAFAKSSGYVRPESQREILVDEDWMKENMADLDAPWRPETGINEKQRIPGYWLFVPQKRKLKLKKLHRNLMHNPMVPLIVRLIVLTFSTLALALAGSIFQKANRSGCTRGPSTYMAIIIDVIAIVYTCYITYDEYTSKPLGLRSPRAKMRLIFLDLIFIVFDSANLSLAFDSLTDERWACREGIFADNQGQEGISSLSTCTLNHEICVRQQALTATLLIALVAWLVTFAVSTLRYVHPIRAFSSTLGCSTDMMQTYRTSGKVIPNLFVTFLYRFCPSHVPLPKHSL
ncbi:hypothetical protein M501DRAFT_938070 [Patellaria atrata CBS 101060]|uniref:Regulator of phospholipase D SRF1 n=1 Tax=Patellaria atrata CBS 101060 TaxID=1346257 RepID=A0A9P4VR88_9PEZI|nr:hypothetical protein M501DRAFT_938070 [Patellaria atrata CBS 101060]